MDHAALADRQGALSRLDLAGLTALLDAQPLAAAGLLGSGALAHVGSHGYWTHRPQLDPPTLQL